MRIPWTLGLDGGQGQFCFSGSSRSQLLRIVIVTVVVLVLLSPTAIPLLTQSTLIQVCPEHPTPTAVIPHYDPNTTYSFYTRRSRTSCVFNFTLDMSDLNQTKVLDTKVDFYLQVYKVNSSWAQPLLISILQEQHITNFKLPYSFDEDVKNSSIWYFSSRKTLCLSKKRFNYSLSLEPIIVSVYTANEDPVRFDMRLEISDGLLIELEQYMSICTSKSVGERRAVTVSPTSTTFYRFDFKNSPGTETVEVIASSAVGEGRSVCTIIATQDPFCPVYDAVENVRRAGYKRMTGAAVVRIRESEYPKGFVIVLVPLSTDLCHNSPTENDSKLIPNGPNSTFRFNREKIIRLKVNRQETLNGYNLVQLLRMPMMIFMISVIVGGPLFCWPTSKLGQFFKKELRDLEREGNEIRLLQENEKMEKNNEAAALMQSQAEINGKQGQASSGETKDVQEFELEKLKNVTGNKKTEGKTEEEPGCSEPPKRKLRPEPGVSYENIVQTEKTSTQRTSNNYCKTVTAISIYFAVPVYQFVVFHYSTMYETGDFDHCYYNEKCRVRFWESSDFNHWVSNLLYVLFGLVFIGMVAYRQLCFKQEKRQELLKDIKDPEKASKFQVGVSIPFGAYYALGVSLIMEGVMSSAYHYCPSASTFQFDVAFMYVISVISISIIYQLRHHLIPHGKVGIVALSLLLLISCIFHWMEEVAPDLANGVFRLIFCGITMVLVTLYCRGLWYFGRVTDKKGVIVLDIHSVARYSIWNRSGILPKTNSPGRRCAAFWIVTSNIVLQIIGSYSSDFGNMLMIILLGNTVLALLVYFFSKVNDGELGWILYLCCCFCNCDSAIEEKKYTTSSEGLHKDHKAFKEKKFRTITTTITVLYIGILVVFWPLAFHQFNIEVTDWKKFPAESRELNKACSWNDYYDHHDVWHFWSAVGLFFSFLLLLTIDDGIQTRMRKYIRVF